MTETIKGERVFRANLSQFRWARGVTDDSQPAAPLTAQPAGNPFSRFYNAVAGDYIPLRSSERSNEEEAWFALSRWERLLGFGGCLIGAAVCFFPRKFALSFSFSVLIGPINHIKHLVSTERLPFTLVYFSSLGLTLYFAMGPHSYLGSLVYLRPRSYVLAYFPGGSATLRLAGSTAFRSAGSLLPR
ncbi:ER-to-golgi vesicle protein transport Sft2 [Mycena rosella]|uniref:Protein transport protein SFT2 n=1 Tax=Mycena rosella TaxID=1033263 RepID=A0AAD7D6Z2_MYCRO|nr:ER-to-golgi vesicle protein transport Sft2 [Mycena rosella]